MPTLTTEAFPTRNTRLLPVTSVAQSAVADPSVLASLDLRHVRVTPAAVAVVTVALVSAVRNYLQQALYVATPLSGEGMHTVFRTVSSPHARSAERSEHPSSASFFAVSALGQTCRSLRK